MKVVQVNHNSDGDALPGIPDVEVGHLKIKGNGVVITLIERAGSIDITVNPSGEPYMHNVKTNEVAANRSQVRVSGIQGSPL